MLKGSEAYEKLTDALTKDNIVKAVKGASSDAQTSCLEGYHSVVNQFAPKMYSYSYLGMLSRTILAAFHFNYNIERVPKTDQNGNVKLRVSYVKYKYGEETVREVKTAQNYEYVKDIYKNLIETPRDHLRVLKIELEAEVPVAMNTMNEKENKHEAIRKYMERKGAQTVLCPPTCTDTELEELVAPPPERGTRKVPICKSCNKPMKGHKIINKKRYCPHQLPVEN